MIELCCEYLCVRCIWLYVRITSLAVLRVNPDSTLLWMFPKYQVIPYSKQAPIWGFSVCSSTQTHNHLIHKPRLNLLAKPAKWLSCAVNTYLYGALDCIFLSCHVGVSIWMHTVYLPDCQGTSTSKQSRNLKFKWLQLDWNPQPLKS